MDSKQLFRLYHSRYHLTNWLNEVGELAQREGDVKWYYCGVGSDFKNEFVSQSVDSTFIDDEVYLCISSNKSLLVPKSNAVIEIANFLHKKEIGILNKSFTKMIFFSQYGTFKIGEIRDFTKNRPRPIGTPLKVKLLANIMQTSTHAVYDIIKKYFSEIENALCNDYGGAMEHLWIDLELAESSKSWSFRFQQRVESPTSYVDFYSYNVSHYSVKPDFNKLKELSTEESICLYVFGLLYDSTQILVDKQKKLDGFNATAFRLDFLAACEKLGFALKLIKE